MAATLDGKDLGTIQEERQTRDNGMFSMPLPTLDSDKMVLFDIFGVTKTINITSIKDGTVAQLRTFISDIEAIQAPIQTGVNFQSTLISGTIKVYVMNFEWSYVAGDPTKLQISLTLIEGVAIS